MLSVAWPYKWYMVDHAHDICFKSLKILIIYGMVMASLSTHWDREKTSDSNGKFTCSEVFVLSYLEVN